MSEAAEDSDAVNAVIGNSDSFLCPVCKGVFSIHGAEAEIPRDGPRNPGSGRNYEGCRTCWEKKMREDIIPLIQDEKERQKQLALVERPRKRKATPSANAMKTGSKKPRVLPGKCKWCGGTDHKTKRSKKCPFSKHQKPSSDSTPTCSTFSRLDSNSCSTFCRLDSDSCSTFSRLHDCFSRVCNKVK